MQDRITHYEREAERYEREAGEHDKVGNALSAKHCRRNATACRETITSLQGGETNELPMPCPDPTPVEKPAEPEPGAVTSALDDDGASKEGVVHPSETGD